MKKFFDLELKTRLWIEEFDRPENVVEFCFWIREIVGKQIGEIAESSTDEKPIQMYTRRIVFDSTHGLIIVIPLERGTDLFY